MQWSVFSPKSYMKEKKEEGKKEEREEVSNCLAYIWIISDTNFIPFSVCKSHSGITAILLKTPICNLTFILDGLYKWTCLHMCWQYWSKGRLNDLFTEKKKNVIIIGAKNRSPDFQSYDLNRRQNVHFIWLIENTTSLKTLLFWTTV